MINKTILQGRLVEDPELRRTQSDIPVASFRVAWSEKYKEIETKCFLTCTAWRGTGEFVSKYFNKGQEILVEGQLVTRTWKDDDGKNRSALELTVDKAHFCGSKSDSKNLNVSGPEAPLPETQQTFKEVDEEDELPF